jgi:hypothetical protein
MQRATSSSNPCANRAQVAVHIIILALACVVHKPARRLQRGEVHMDRPWEALLVLVLLGYVPYKLPVSTADQESPATHQPMRCSRDSARIRHTRIQSCSSELRAEPVLFARGQIPVQAAPSHASLPVVGPLEQSKPSEPSNLVPPAYLPAPCSCRIPAPCLLTCCRLIRCISGPILQYYSTDTVRMALPRSRQRILSACSNALQFGTAASPQGGRGSCTAAAMRLQRWQGICQEVVHCLQLLGASLEQQGK